MRCIRAKEKNFRFIYFQFFVLIFFAESLFAQYLPGKMLEDFSAYDASRFGFAASSAKIISTGTNSHLEVTFNGESARPYMRFYPRTRGTGINFGIRVQIKNLNKFPITLFAGLNGQTYIGDIVRLDPEQVDTLGVIFTQRGDVPQYLKTALPEAGSFPGGWSGHWFDFDPDNLSSMEIYAVNIENKSNIVFAIDNIETFGKLEIPSEAWINSDFFPIVDKLFQYKHKEWKGKLKIEQDLLTSKAAEDKDLLAKPGIATYSRFSGYGKGPRLDSTGHFRVEKYNGKWWYVDPDGYLFWSSGTDGFMDAEINVSGVENHFEWLPPRTGDYTQFYRYNGSKGKDVVDVLGINLYRKYGKDFKAEYVNQTIRRFKSWGFTSFAGWTKPAFYNQSKLPYSSCWWIYMPTLANLNDTTAYVNNLKKGLQERFNLDDPYLMGFYIGNELEWDKVPASELDSLASKFYRLNRKAIKELRPHLLYMGDRYNRSIKTVLITASKYCDVMSFNKYQYSNTPSSYIPAEGMDRPIQISEFQFCSLDQGEPGVGLVPVYNQRNRASAYKTYMLEAIKDPRIIGAHWFIYSSGIVHGMWNSNHGVVDITDRPYPELVDAIRYVSSTQYQYRLAGALISDAVVTKIDGKENGNSQQWNKNKFVTSLTFINSSLNIIALSKISKIEVVNLQGKIIHSFENIDRFSVSYDLAISPGIYFIRIKNTDFSVIRSIVVNQLNSGFSY